MKLITEYLPGTTESIFIEEAGTKNLYIEGIFMQSAVKNRNGRIYPTAILENAVNKYINEDVTMGSAIGELNHPASPNPNPERASHRITELRKEGNDFYGKALVLNTPQGNIVRGLLEGGTRLGVSSRGLGTTKPVNGINEVQNDYLLKCVDVVLNPSAPSAFVNGIMEGVDFGLDGRTVEEVEAIIHATPAGKLAEVKYQLFREIMLSEKGWPKLDKYLAGPKKKKVKPAVKTEAINLSTGLSQLTKPLLGASAKRNIKAGKHPTPYSAMNKGVTKNFTTKKERDLYLAAAKRQDEALVRGKGADWPSHMYPSLKANTSKKKPSTSQHRDAVKRKELKDFELKMWDNDSDIDPDAAHAFERVQEVIGDLVGKQGGTKLKVFQVGRNTYEAIGTVTKAVRIDVHAVQDMYDSFIDDRFITKIEINGSKITAFFQVR